MAIQEIGGEDSRQLQNIANIVASSKKIVVITGAGISTNCGIPVSGRDFSRVCCFPNAS